jgi:4-carboxymuconolactone decarboxylase
MADSEARRRGREWFAEVMGFPAPPLEGDPFYDVTLEHLFANVWARPGLGVKERRIATLVVLMCLGNEPTLKMHVRAALETGQLTDTEMDELIVHVAHYAGWPPAAIASQVLRAVRTERSQKSREGSGG